MPEEEFQESEVIFSDNNNNNNNNTHEDVDDGGGYKSEKNTKKVVVTSSSVPVSIPRHHGGVFHYEFEGLEDNLVPPHVISERRIAGKMAFSVCTGNGRTLKGRDLSQVRNSVLRLTGFLEA